MSHLNKPSLATTLSSACAEMFALVRSMEFHFRPLNSRGYRRVLTAAHKKLYEVQLYFFNVSDLFLSVCGVCRFRNSPILPERFVAASKAEFAA